MIFISMKNMLMKLKEKLLIYKFKILMKKTIYLIVSSALALSCSSDDSGSSTPTDNNPTPESYERTATPSDTTVAVDETFTVDVSSDDALKFVLYSYDNFATEGSNYFGDTPVNNVQLKFSYAELGTKTLYIKAINMDNEVSTIKTVPITIVRGNALKITGIEVVSFYQMGTSWDPEYSSTDPNRLADVFMGFGKKEISNPFTGTLSNTAWFQTDVRTNEVNLTWDLSNLNHYVQPDKTVITEVADYDDGSNVELLMPFPVGYTIDFSPYIATKPTTMTFSYPSYELEFILTVEWAD